MGRYCILPLHGSIALTMKSTLVDITVNVLFSDLTLITTTCHVSTFNKRAGALMQWLKLPACKVRDRGFKPHSGLPVSKKQNISSPLTRKDLILCVASVIER